MVSWRLVTTKASIWLEVRERESVGQASQSSQDKASVAVFSRKNTTDDPSSRLSSKQQRSRRKLNLNHNRTKMVEKEKLFLSCRATLFRTFPKSRERLKS